MLGTQLISARQGARLRENELPYSVPVFLRRDRGNCPVPRHGAKSGLELLAREEASSR